ncbi:hypothetical protein ABZ297_11655 [Nonomuraea sp. NPDC005983]|uniref:hypothetical protein n=1 Tax=Nonomuraea sp. NPDC005983 TaxID=3155595 RepID=UPI0033A5BCB9
MEWLFSQWMFTAAVFGGADVLLGPVGDVPPAADEQLDHPRPTSAESWLIETAYNFIAADLTCGKCGALLGRPRVLARSWPVRITVRCTGIRRHRHRADVRRTADGLWTPGFSRAASA